MHDARAEAMAQAALVYWGKAAGPPRLIKNRENVVFEARLEGGAHVALRLHRPGYQSRAAVEAELRWCAALAEAGFPAPAPVAARNGRLTAMVDRSVVSCVVWLDGAPIGAGDAPLGPDAGAVRAEAEALGALVARLHGVTDGLDMAGFARKPWDADGLLGARPRWGRFWENPSLSGEERDALLAAREMARERIAGAVDYGPIHADILRENVLRGPAGLSLIDFDDCGPGYRLYDLASCIIQGIGDPLLPDFVEGLLAGYRGGRDLPEDQAALLPVFVALRAFASAGWIISRGGADDPRLRGYAERALVMARAMQEGRAPWERPIA